MFGWMLCIFSALAEPMVTPYRVEHPILPVADHSVQWLSQGEIGVTAMAWPVRRGGAAIVVAPVDWGKWGISADTELWLRTSDGLPATRVHIAELGLSEYGECGGYSGVYLKLDGANDGLLYVGKPPASWMAPTPASTLSSAQKALIEADLARRADTLGETVVTTIYAGDQAFSRITLPGEDRGYAGRDYSVIDVISDGKTTKLGREFTDTSRGASPEPTPQWLFDVNGDGSLDVVFHGDATEVTTMDGKPLASDNSVVCY